MRIENGWFYFSIDKDGFYLEIGNLDKGTAFITLAFTRNWWDEEVLGKKP